MVSFPPALKLRNRFAAVGSEQVQETKILIILQHVSVAGFLLTKQNFEIVQISASINSIITLMLLPGSAFMLITRSVRLEAMFRYFW